MTFSSRAEKDFDKLRKDKALLKRAQVLLDLIEVNPFEKNPPYGHLKGRLSGFYSRRINIQHRLVYKVVGEEILVISMWSHYEF